jgi:DMSO/TMAO reductase YedYZ molybdopterin-dependent catalytic subunit
LAAPLNLLWLLAVFAAWGAVHGLIFAHLTAEATNEQPLAATSPTQATYVPPMMRTELSTANATPAIEVMNRRQFLIKLGGASAVITVAGTGLSAWLNASRAAAEIAEVMVSPAKVYAAPVTDGMLVPAPGTRPEYTPLKAHYRIDINIGSGPVIAEEGYKLELSGLVENPTALTVAQIRADFPAVERIITMSCISNPVAGDLIGTTKWTGISMQKLLDLVKPTPEATHIRISAADGFWEIVSLDVIREDDSVMLAYAWDDQPLTGEHGFPLRIHIPNRYGMKQPKWITKMEFIAGWEPGYWVERGWDREALVRATSVIDTVAVDDAYEQEGQKLIPIGGIAWAGTKGISKVEVRVDEGEWQPAQLRTPLSDRTWVLWRYEWPFAADWHTFTVRCYDGDGVAQIEEEADVRPSGATGLHYKQANV